jgi:hypothetical protein
MLNWGLHTTKGLLRLNSLFSVVNSLCYFLFQFIYCIMNVIVFILVSVTLIIFINIQSILYGSNYVCCQQENTLDCRFWFVLVKASLPKYRHLCLILRRFEVLIDFSKRMIMCIINYLSFELNWWITILEILIKSYLWLIVTRWTIILTRENIFFNTRY